MVVNQIGADKNSGHNKIVNQHSNEKSEESQEIPLGFGPIIGVSSVDRIELETEARGDGNEEIHAESLTLESKEDDLEEARKTWELGKILGK